MEIAFPVNENLGLESPVHDHFGTASRFVIVETEKETFEMAENADLGHAHGQCQPLAILGGRRVDAVVVAGIGPGALRKLQSLKIRAYRAVEGTVAENLALIKSGRLPEFMMNQTCGGHCHH